MVRMLYAIQLLYCQDLSEKVADELPEWSDSCWRGYFLELSELAQTPSRLLLLLLLVKFRHAGGGTRKTVDFEIRQ